MTAGRWMEIISWLSSEQIRPLALIVLAQNDGGPLDEMALAGQAAILNQQVTGSPVETAVMVKQIHDLEEHGMIEKAPDGFRWQLTGLGVLASRQWMPGNTEPPGREPLERDSIRAWRDRVVQLLDEDAERADEADIDRYEWFMTENRRLVELHVLNRVLGESKTPDWLVAQRFEAQPEAPENG